mgnify:CR=1 FL=1
MLSTTAPKAARTSVVVGAACADDSQVETTEPAAAVSARQVASPTTGVGEPERTGNSSPLVSSLLIRAALRPVA